MWLKTMTIPPLKTPRQSLGTFEAHRLWQLNLQSGEKKTPHDHFFFYICLEFHSVLESIKEDSDTRLCTACPGGKAL